jgi:hypothetical protein
MAKIVELLLYLSHKRQHVDHYKACKLVYLADWVHLNQYGRPIAADVPRAMQFGPVATKSYELLKRNPAALKEAGVDDLPLETKQLDKIIYIGAPKRAVQQQASWGRLLMRARSMPCRRCGATRITKLVLHRRNTPGSSRSPLDVSGHACR